MRRLLPLLTLGSFLLLLPRGMDAVPTVAAVDAVLAPGAVELDLFLDPEGERLGAYLLKFEASAGFTVLGVQLLEVAGCDQMTSGPDANGRFSIDGQCALSALEAGTLVAQVTVQGALDGLLQLDPTSNWTDFDTFLDAAVDPIAPVGVPGLPDGTLAVVVPEPSTLGLFGLGLAGLARRRRARD
jgi:hypothetical protein